MAERNPKFNDGAHSDQTILGFPYRSVSGLVFIARPARARRCDNGRIYRTLQYGREEQFSSKVEPSTITRNFLLPLNHFTQSSPNSLNKLRPWIIKQCSRILHNWQLSCEYILQSYSIVGSIYRGLASLFIPNYFTVSMSSNPPATLNL